MRKTLYDFCIETQSGLLAEWDAEKNAPLTPHGVSYGSKRRAWWRCEKGHSWEAVISSRTRGSRCPVCAGRTAEPGVNDLATLYPRLMDEWVWEKNTGLRPETLLPNSHKKAWWRCERDHVWLAEICSRARGSGCPYCAGKRISPGENDLESVNPRLAAEWNRERNGALTPREVTEYSNRRVW